jgi:HAD superfamily hydrolase (TIGR01549 family)
MVRPWDGGRFTVREIRRAKFSAASNGGMEYDAVIFDNDGVLVELVAMDVLRDATREAFDAVGVADPDPDHVEDLTIDVTPDQVRTVADAYGVAPDALWRARDRASSDAQIEVFGDGRWTRYDDVGALAAIDAPRGVVSTNQQATVDFVLDHFGLADLFETAYGREATVESLRKKKPNPHYLERAMTDLGAETALFVGDSESDVLAAHRAGADSAFLRRDHRAGLELGESPTHDVQSLYDLHAVDAVPVDRNGPSVASDGGTER